MKNGTISSRASIVQRSKGQSAVEQSAYISRTSLYSDYYGMTYNRTAKEEKVKRLAEIQILKKHIFDYFKTKDVYADYRKCGYSKKFL